MALISNIFRTLCGRELSEEEKRERVIKAVGDYIDSGSYRMVERLLPKVDANANVPYYEGTDHTHFLHLAVIRALANWETRVKYIYIIRLLLEAGADMNLADSYGHKCIDDIEMMPRVIKLFMEFGYDGKFVECIDFDDDMDNDDDDNDDTEVDTDVDSSIKQETENQNNENVNTSNNDYNDDDRDKSNSKEKYVQNDDDDNKDPKNSHTETETNAVAMTVELESST